MVANALFMESKNFLNLNMSDRLDVAAVEETTELVSRK